MFEIISSIFSKKNDIKSLIEKTKINVEKRNEEFPFDLLGRSLSLNPYPPRAFDFDFAPFVKNNTINLKCIKDESNIINLSSDLGLVVADTTAQKDISLIATLRRYSPFIIIHKDIIISKYQILESLVYGADMIVLDYGILDSNSFEILFDFANHLGLRVVLDSATTDDFDISSEIFSNIDFVISNRVDIINDKIAIHLEN